MLKMMMLVAMTTKMMMRTSMVFQSRLPWYRSSFPACLHEREGSTFHHNFQDRWPWNRYSSSGCQNKQKAERNCFQQDDDGDDGEEAGDGKYDYDDVFQSWMQ